MAERLGEYEAKRAFGQTPEPRGSGVGERRGPLAFSIQKHDATRLHYDLRLELNGVLRSWALPKGFTLTYGEKHLAVATEDHPLEYLTWEGVIPAGQYGAGEMIVWDCGVYSPDEGGVYSWHDREEAEARLNQELEAGKTSFFLRGTKLKGSFALVRMKDGENWLLLKHRDRWVREEGDPMAGDESPLTGVSIDDLKQGVSVHPVRIERAAPHGPEAKRVEAAGPMLATLADNAFDDPDWLFEPKLDGYRTMAVVENGAVKLLSRRGLDVTSQYPDLTARFGAQNVRHMVVDGEIVAFGADGKPSFNAMQKRAQLKDPALLAAVDRESPCVFYAFDLLAFEGCDLRAATLEDRRRWLRQCLLADERLLTVDGIVGEGNMMYDVAIATGFEGVVAKKLDSRYESGRRSRQWLKVKHVQSGEFVVAGYAQGQGSRGETFGSLVLGVWHEGELVYAGNVGSGFDEAKLEELKPRLEALQTPDCPFKTKPPTLMPTTWVKPELVVEVKFHEWTPDGNLRAPVFLRERDEVDPRAVERVGAVHVGPPTDRFPGGVTQKDVDAVLAQLEGSSKEALIEVGPDSFVATNLGKKYWDDHTKRDHLRYLAKVSKFMLRHLIDKPLTLIRFPEGIHGERFYQKHWDAALPSFVETITLFSGTKGVNHTYIACNNLATLLWLGHLGTLEFHVPHMRAARHPDGDALSFEFTDNEENLDRSILNYPDYLAFDLDPYIYAGHEKAGDEPEFSEAGFAKGKEVAFWLKELLDSLGLKSFVKLSGKTGLHIFAPIVRNLTFDEVRAICETFSRSLLVAHPNDITIEWSTQKRTGKIFMDYNMNVRGKTLNCAYSPRALPGCPVSTPVTWEELPTADPRNFTLDTAPARLEKVGDLWAGLLDAKVDLMGLLG